MKGPFGALAREGFLSGVAKIINLRGGERVRIPKKPRGYLLSVIGEAALTRLIYLCGGGGGYRCVPSKSWLEGAKKSKILQLLSDGKGSAEIARELGVTDGYVSEVRRAATR